MLSVSEYRMVFPERTNKNYALKENAFASGLEAVTLCFFAKDNPRDSSDEFQCPFSYGVSGSHNELTFCTSPTLRVLVNGEIRFFFISYIFSIRTVVIREGSFFLGVGRAGEFWYFFPKKGLPSPAF